jgi:hypothetical protein
MEIWQNDLSDHTQLKDCYSIYNITSYPILYERIMEDLKNNNTECKALFGTMWVYAFDFSDLSRRFCKLKHFSLSDMGIMLNQSQKRRNNHITYKIDINEVDVQEFSKMISQLTIADFKSLI